MTMRSRKITDEVGLAIIAKFDSGKTTRKIAAELKLSPGQVAGYLHRKGIKRGADNSRILAAAAKKVSLSLNTTEVKHATPYPDQKKVTKVEASEIKASKNAWTGNMRATRRTTHSKEIKLAAEAPTPTPTLLADISLRKQCCWPYGDPKDADFHYCGQARHKGSYCERHFLAAQAGERVRRNHQKLTQIEV